MFRLEFFGLITKTYKFDGRTYEIRLGWERNEKRLVRNFFHNFCIPRRDGGTEGVVGSLQARACMDGEGRSETTYLYLIRMLIEKCVCVCFLCLHRRLLLGARRRRLREPFVTPGEILLRLQQRRLRGVHLLRLRRQRQPF